MNKLFVVAKRVLGICFVVMMVMSCSKDVIEPVVPPVVAKPVDVVVTPVTKDVNLTFVENKVVKVTKKVIVLKAGESYSQAYDTRNKLYTYYVKFKGVTTPLPNEIGTFYADNVQVDSEVEFISIINPKAAEILDNKDSAKFEFYSEKVGDDPEHFDELTPQTLTFKSDGTVVRDYTGVVKKQFTFDWNIVSLGNDDPGLFIGGGIMHISPESTKEYLILFKTGPEDCSTCSGFIHKYKRIN